MRKHIERVRTGLCALAAMGVALSGGETAHAVGISTAGEVCSGNDQITDDLITHQFAGTAYISSAGRGVVVCPLSVDHSINPSADFDVVLVDQNDNNNVDGGFECQGVVVSPTGSILGSTPSMTTTGPFVGQVTRTASFNVGLGSTNSYYVRCAIPSFDFGPSQVRVVRVD
jgi:hypothetical protein